MCSSKAYNWSTDTQNHRRWEKEKVLSKIFGWGKLCHVSPKCFVPNIPNIRNIKWKKWIEYNLLHSSLSKLNLMNFKKLSILILMKGKCNAEYLHAYLSSSSTLQVRIADTKSNVKH